MRNAEHGAVARRLLAAGALLSLTACTSGPSAPRPVAPTCATCGPAPQAVADADASAAHEVPEPIRAWMDRLSVAHEFDPATGFIVAREVVPLPPSIAAAPPLREAVALSRRRGVPLVVFATADRCAPCQQFRLDALNDPRVIDLLRGDDRIATHIEVDRDPAAAREFLGGPAIPTSYLLRDGAVVATLRGQRSADDLLSWLAAQGL